MKSPEGRSQSGRPYISLFNLAPKERRSLSQGVPP